MNSLMGDLIEGYTLDQILDIYVNCKYLHVQYHPTLPLAIYNYTQKTQFEGFWDDITLMCRAKVFDLDGNAITRPLRKFFNIEENRHIATNKFDVFAKVDGSLITLFIYDGQLVISSRGSFTSIHCGWAKEILDQIEKETGYIVKNNLREGWTYCLELIHPDNRIVCDYKGKKDLVLLAVFDENGVELPYKGLSHPSGYCLLDYSSLFTIVKRYDGIEDYTKLQELNTPNEEGFVIRFDNGDRVKAKFQHYVRLHRIMSDCTNIRVWEALSSGAGLDQFLENTPDEFYSSVRLCSDDLLLQYSSIEEKCKVVFNFINDSPTRAKFAEQAKSTDISGILFAMLDGKSYENYIWKLVKPKISKKL